MRGEHLSPADIEATSMKIIDEELRRRNIRLRQENATVIRRVIHTTADFDYAENLVFTPGAVSHGVEALRAGRVIVTDTNMALAGVSRAGLAKLRTQAICYMSDPEVADAARSAGTTRAVASMDKAFLQNSDVIFAVGNAPTSLFAIDDHIMAGMRPALVIAVPVGFVNVIEAKEEVLRLCTERRIPAIVALGNKGGSSVAAAICNALIYQSTNQSDPFTRSW